MQCVQERWAPMPEVLKEVLSREPGVAPLDSRVGIVHRDNAVINGHCPQEDKSGMVVVEQKDGYQRLSAPVAVCSR